MALKDKIQPGITRAKRAAADVERRVEPVADYVIQKVGLSKHTGLIVAGLIVILVVIGALAF